MHPSALLQSLSSGLAECLFFLASTITTITRATPIRIPGTIPAMNISAIDTPVIEAYTTNAILGGMTMAMELDVAIRAVENGALKPPRSTIAGIRTAPSAATVAGPDPENCAEEAGYNNAYNGDAASFMYPRRYLSNLTSLLEIPAFAMIFPESTEKRDSQKEKFTDSGIHIGCNNGKGGSGVQDCTDGGQSQTDCNGNSHDQENKK